jgi:cell filamentation protein
MSDTRTSPPSDDERRELEARYVRVRLAELQGRPPDPTFDETHLRAIHRHIFQDLPRKGLHEHHPGEYRPATGEGADWIKHRQLETVPTRLYVPYSAMDQGARSRLNRELSAVNIYGLRALTRDHLATELSSLYARLDYLHPFHEGNSRTLRFFFTQLADESDHHFDWDKLSGSPQQRDRLYIARDVAVLRQALPHVRGERALQLATATLDRLEGNPSLEQLFGRSLRPLRALAFEQLMPSAATMRYPALRDVYASIEAATHNFSEQYKPTPAVLARFGGLLREAVQKSLDQGRILSARDVHIPLEMLTRHDHQRSTSERTER